MKTHAKFILLASSLVSLATVTASLQAAAEETTAPTEWPRIFLRNGVTNTIYQPQMISWNYRTLKATCAVAIQRAGAPQPTFGSIELMANTWVDRADREVFFQNVEITSGNFPSAGQQASSFLATLRSLVPKEVNSISLDRMEASLAILEARERASGLPVRNVPPAILFSTRPAMLVPIDGPAIYRPVSGTKLERVFNSRALILRNNFGDYYLHLFDGYLTASSLDGPWSVVDDIPGEVKEAEKEAVKAKQVDLLAGQENPKTKQKPSLKFTPVPELHVTFDPTELIVIQGEPQWLPIPQTQLLFVTNTASHVFKALPDQETYVLISGRWFRAPGFDGPWEFVSGGDLPKDFAAIPDASSQENVKAAVPGTRQAQEAAIANSIPQTIKVDRKTAKLDPTPQYEGDPQLKPISGTTLQYAANCETPVIRADEKSWFACQNGVWFVAGAASGPWAVATNVPAAIYSIPPASPMHYLVYSRIYNYDDDYVWIGTTPGYYGTVIGSDGTVVYGTGYYYPPYVGSATYVCYPLTYGYGCNPCWTPWAGWAFGFSVCWAMDDDWYWWCYCPPAPYWGAYWYPCYGSYYNAYGGITAWGPYGWAGTTGYIYHQNGPWSGVTRGAAGYNAWTGNEWATTYGRAYNSTTGTQVAGQRGAVENVYTGNYAYGGRAAGYNQNTGAAAAGRKVTWGNTGSGNQGTAGRATVYNPNTGKTSTVGGISGEKGSAININGHVIAGNNGSYYRPDGNGGWQEITRPESYRSNPTTTAANRSIQTPEISNQWRSYEPNVQQRQSLENEFQARRYGEMRQQSFQMNRPAFRGGGFRGGGFRR